MLYLAFGAFATLRIENKISAWLLFASITIAIQILTKYCIGRHAIMSIPYFAIGVFASEFKEKCLWAFNVSILPLVVYPAIAVFFLQMHSAVIINSAVMAALIIALTLWKPKVACPAVLSSLAFDIYLVHNKVLMTGRTYTDNFPVWAFVTFTIVAALVFYFIRTLLLQPKTLIKSIKLK